MIVIDVRGEIINGNLAAIMRKYFGDGGDTEFSVENLREAIASGEPDDDVLLNLDSYGGDIEAALQIYDELRGLGRKIYANIIGDASSAASILLLAAEKKNRSANAHASAVLHYTSGGVSGKVEDVEALAADMHHFNNELANVYVERTGMSRKRVEDLLAKDVRHFAPELLSMGFISSINKHTSAMTFAIETQRHEYTRRIAAIAKPIDAPAETLMQSINKLFTN